MISSVLELAERIAQPSKVLVVDDDAGVCETLSLGLTRMGCYPVVVFTGASALSCLSGVPGIAVVLLDIRLPDMTGDCILEVMKRLKMNIPVIVMTAYATGELVELLGTYGVVAVLRKPVEDFCAVLSRYFDILNIRHLRVPGPTGHIPQSDKLSHCRPTTKKDTI